MPRVVCSSDTQENSLPSSNFSRESNGSHLGVERPFGVVGQPGRLSLESSRPLAWEQSTAPFGAVVGMKFSLAGVLDSVPLATDNKGPSSPGHAKRRKNAIKLKRMAGDKNALVSAGRPMDDDHIDLAKGATRCKLTMTILLGILQFPTCTRSC
ncbi:hypothetical protein Fot_28901 [Forsythia ovata]|uniref:Uncharacterized protein n=1 Tax=Forsythia ovata TaxID=205694 RepID=A0ABD1TQC0_9LAMI